MDTSTLALRIYLEVLHQTKQSRPLFPFYIVFYVLHQRWLHCAAYFSNAELNCIPSSFMEPFEEFVFRLFIFPGPKQ